MSDNIKEILGSIVLVIVMYFWMVIMFTLDGAPFH
jgi:hypothetical protein